MMEVFSCEFCKISKNTFFTEHIRWLRLFLAMSVTHESIILQNVEVLEILFELTEVTSCNYVIMQICSII